jgi:hypothetical protein
LISTGSLLQLFIQENIATIQQLFSTSLALRQYLESVRFHGQEDAPGTSSPQQSKTWSSLATPFVKTVMSAVSTGYHFAKFLSDHEYYVHLQV